MGSFLHPEGPKKLIIWFISDICPLFPLVEERLKILFGVSSSHIACVNFENVYAWMLIKYPSSTYKKKSVSLFVYPKLYTIKKSNITENVRINT